MLVAGNMLAVSVYIVCMYVGGYRYHGGCWTCVRACVRACIRGWMASWMDG